jgi:hypothetical protein
MSERDPIEKPAHGDVWVRKRRNCPGFNVFEIMPFYRPNDYVRELQNTCEPGVAIPLDLAEAVIAACKRPKRTDRAAFYKLAAQLAKYLPQEIKINANKSRLGCRESEIQGQDDGDLFSDDG